MYTDSTLSLAILIAVLVAGLVLSALGSAARRALMRTPRASASDLRHVGASRAETVGRLLEHRRESIAGTTGAIVVGNTAVAVAVTMLMAGLLNRWWEVTLGSLAATALLMALASATRGTSRKAPISVIHALAPVISVSAAIARPFTAFGDRNAADGDERDVAAAGDLRDMVVLVSENEHMEEPEREMLHSVFELGTTLTREVMVPRTDMITIGLDTPLDKALALFVRSGFSRIPVIGDNADDIRGVLYLKDALRASRWHSSAELTAETVMRTPVLVPEMKPVDDLMRDMQATSSHIAIAIDEYGGVAGLVTMEDIIEELVGELQDEHDRDIAVIEQIEDGVFRIPARLPVDELGELFDLALEDNEVDTAGGLLAKTLGRVPIEGAEATTQGLRLVAEAAGGRRRQIVTMIVSLAEDEEDPQ